VKGVEYLLTSHKGMDALIYSAVERQRGLLFKLRSRRLPERPSQHAAWRQRYEREVENGWLRLQWVVASQEAIAFEREVWSTKTRSPWRIGKSIPQIEKAHMRNVVLEREKNERLGQYKAELNRLARAYELLKYQLTKG